MKINFLKLNSKFLVLTSVLVILFAFCLYPFGLLIFKVIFAHPEGPSFEYFKVITQSPFTRKALFNTLKLSSWVTFVCSFIALFLSWILARTNIPFVDRLRTWLCLPYAIPPYIGAIAWIALANPSTGILTKIFGKLAPNIYSFQGLVWTLTCFMYTFVLLTCLSFLENMDSSLEEAAQISGASKWRIYWDITLPLLRPALFSGLGLTFLATAASFGVPALIGTPARIYLLTTQIYTYQKMGTLTGPFQASAISIILLVFAFIILSTNSYLMRSKKFAIVSGKSSRLSRIDLGRWKWPLFLLVCLFLFLVFFLPLLGLFVSAFSKVQGQFSWQNLSFDTWKMVLFNTNETARSFSNSFILALGSATFASLFGLFIAYIQIKTKLPGRSLLDTLATLPYSAPGPVVALALILTFGPSFFGLPFSLYGTMGILFLAYIVKYLSFSVKTNSDALAQVHDSLAEASRVSGASWGQTMRYIWLPLLRTSMMASWFLIFLPVFSELTMTLLLTAPGLETVGTLIFQMQEYGDVSGSGASVLALLVVALTLFLNYAIKKLSNGKYGL